jgi:hypothetical protein
MVSRRLAGTDSPYLLGFAFFVFLCGDTPFRIRLFQSVVAMRRAVEFCATLRDHELVE